jgi:hypothetical protein
LLAVLFVALMPGLHAADQKPNFVFFLIDAMPWFGSPVRMDADMPAFVAPYSWGKQQTHAALVFSAEFHIRHENSVSSCPKRRPCAITP